MKSILIYFLILLQFSMVSCAKLVFNTTLEDFCRIKPKSWDCEIIQKDFDKNDIPQNCKEPVAIIKYKNPNVELNRFETFKFNPSLILNFYPINQKKELIEFIKSQQFYSWCIPVYYGETKDYFIVTSPCFINEGSFTNEAISSIKELQRAIDRIVTKMDY